MIRRIRPHLIRLSAESVRAAFHYQERIYATGITDTDNYTGISEPNRFAIGYMGEFAVVDVFRKFLPYDAVRHYIRIDGRSQLRSEILAGGVRIEVKTAGKPTHLRFMIPLAQRLLNADAYVGARLMGLDEGIVEVWGWLTPDEVEMMPVRDFGKGPTRHCLLVAMHGFEELIGQLKPRGSVQ